MTSESKPIVIKNNTSSGWLWKRHVLTAYAFFGFFVGYAMRAMLSVAIVDMARDVSDFLAESDAEVRNTTAAERVLHVGKTWTPVLQGYILASFFYGYILTQIPAAFLTSKYGGRVFFGAGIGVCSILSLIMPFAAWLGPSMLIVLRILQGLAQGVMFPSMHCMWSKWSPPEERSTLATFAFSGSYMGSVAAFGLGGIIGQMFSWQAIFYVFGALGVVWTVLWFVFVYESPAEHYSISQHERAFIESSLTPHDSSERIPWSKILTSSAVWAIVCAHFAENWGVYTMLTEMPTFLAETMGYKIDKAGLVSALPYLTMSILVYVSGAVSDLLVRRKMSYTHVRKIFCCSGLVAQALFMLILTLSWNSTLIIGCIILAVGFGGLPWAAFGVNHLDIGAGYANVLMSLSNTAATLPGIISPVLTGHLTVHQSMKSEWNAVFLICAVVFVLGALFFGLLASGETQAWALQQHSSTKSSPSKSIGVENLALADADNNSKNYNTQNS